MMQSSNELVAPISDSWLIIGASSAIAQKLISECVKQDERTKIFAVSRSPKGKISNGAEKRVHWIQSDYSEASIIEIVSLLKEEKLRIRQVIICNGILHNEKFSPEKSLVEIKIDNLQEVMRINAFIPILWVKHLKPVLAKSKRCTITAFSARVGSIEDNRKGGWYSYRASKAALNMLMKSASIEYSRSPKHVNFVLFHPGTTESALSRPFLERVTKESIFQPQLVAEYLIEILANLNKDDDLKFLAWNGETVPW
jgi:NAD(P)-dependent dehydrogenase (short-subunit alcohol dehydrogenase family)